MAQNESNSQAKIVLDGSFDTKGRCQRILVNGIKANIQPRCYGYLLALARALNNGAGWLHKHDFPGVEWERQHAIVYRLREQSKLHILNNGRGSYKLDCKEVIILERNRI